MSQRLNSNYFPQNPCSVYINLHFHSNQPNVGIYTMHGSLGFGICEGDFFFITCWHFRTWCLYTLWHPPWNYRIAPENRLKRPKRKLYSLPTIHFFQVLLLLVSGRVILKKQSLPLFFLSNQATASTFERDWPQVVSPIFRTDGVYPMVKVHGTVTVPENVGE